MADKLNRPDALEPESTEEASVEEAEQGAGQKRVQRRSEPKAGGSKDIPDSQGASGVARDTPQPKKSDAESGGNEAAVSDARNGSETQAPPPTADQDRDRAGEAPAKPGAAAATRPGGKKMRQVSSGIAHIKATFNNTLVTISDGKGSVIAWSSAGRLGFTGTKKSSAYAATMVAQDAARQAAACRLQEVEVHVQGPGSGRESAIRALQSAGLTVNAIIDVTPIPHNGCRPRKSRRV